MHSQHACTTLPISADLSMKDNQPYPLTNLQLAGWRLSANVSKQLTFQQKLERFCWQHGAETPPTRMPPPGVRVGWCGKREINPISVSLNTILEFLKDQFKDGKAYRTINVYCSALSAVLPAIDSSGPISISVTKRDISFATSSTKIFTYLECITSLRLY